MSEYILLPFNFKTMDYGYILLVNQVGEYEILNRNDFQNYYSKNLSEDSDIYIRLKSKHFLTTEHEKKLVIDMLATKLRTKKDYISEFTSLHMIVVTLRCNCACKYCHASSVDFKTPNFDMNWDTAKKTINMIFQTPSQNIKIEYQGGEPLLNWKIIKESVLYAKFLNKFAKKNLSFVICTNLTQITKNQLNFCKKHSIDISTSLDGTKELHDQNRQSRIFESSYNAFINKLNLTRKILGNNGCSPLLTITKSNVDKLKEVIDEYVSLGFKSIFLRTLNPFGNAIKNNEELNYPIDEFVDSYKDALEYIIELNKQGINFKEDFTTLLLTRILTPFSTGFVDLQSPTGAGISAAIYNYDGNIYPADEARMLARMGDNYFCLGTVNDKYEEVFAEKKIRHMIKNSCVENMTICSECAYQQYCGADIIRNYFETGDILGTRLNNDFCNKNRKILDYLFSLLLSNDNDIIDIFWSWVTNRTYGDIKLGKY